MSAIDPRMTEQRYQWLSGYWSGRVTEASATGDMSAITVALAGLGMVVAAYCRCPLAYALVPDPVSVPVRVKEGRP